MPGLKGETHDQQVNRLLEKIESEKALIKEIEKPQYKTNMSYSPVANDLSKSTNLNTLNDVAALIGVLAEIASKVSFYDSAAKELKVDRPPLFKWQGYQYNDWSHDIKLRIDKIQIKERQDRLKQLEEALNKLISPELRTLLELKRIAAELGE